MPATTSSPWALRRNSPYSTRSPVEGSREKQTPVPERVAEVAEHHLADVDRGAERVGDVARAPVDLRARRVPAAEDRRDREPQLLARVLRERVPRALRVDRLEVADDLGERILVEIDVVPDALDRASRGPGRPRTGATRRPRRRSRTSAAGAGRSRARSAGRRSRARVRRPSRRSARGSGSCPSCPASRRPRPSARTRAAAPAHRPAPSPTRCSNSSSASSISSARPSGQTPFARDAAMHASVVTVKPSVTGMPSESISARPAPLPPSRLRISEDPSENA